MNASIPLYDWVRDGDSIQLGRIVSVQRTEKRDTAHDMHPSGGVIADEILSVEIRVTETLFGQTDNAVRHLTIERPSSQLTRLKFPDPLWGRVDFRNGAALLIVSRTPDWSPVYADDVVNPDDPVLTAIRTTAGALHQTVTERLRTFLTWLSQPQAVLACFAAEALAKDTAFATDRRSEGIASALSQAFLDQRDLALRIIIGSAMWDQVFGEVAPSGQSTILNATISALQDTSDDMRTFALDRLLTVDDFAVVERSHITPNPVAARFLSEQLPNLSDPQDRSRVTRLIQLLSR